MDKDNPLSEAIHQITKNFCCRVARLFLKVHRGIYSVHTCAQSLNLIIITLISSKTHVM